MELVVKHGCSKVRGGKKRGFPLHNFALCTTAGPAGLAVAGWNSGASAVKGDAQGLPAYPRRMPES